MTDPRGLDIKVKVGHRVADIVARAVKGDIATVEEDIDIVIQKTTAAAAREETVTVNLKERVVVEREDTVIVIQKAKVEAEKEDIAVILKMRIVAGIESISVIAVDNEVIVVKIVDQNVQGSNVPSISVFTYPYVQIIADIL